MTIVTRFAPSPTGFLHIGSARTALFNWLFARHHGGKYLLRIEDTDRARSTQEAIDAIVHSLTWLNLDWDGEIVFQFSRADRHAAAARQLLAEGKAYYCYCSQAELDHMRQEALAQGRQPRYDGRWRDKNASEAPKGIPPVIRIKTPQVGATTLQDHVQGPVTVAHEQLDDFVLLRADGTPTYMLSVVVDDHDMGVTHIIRGDDHLTNSFRQKVLYDAFGWTMPELCHIPLIHGPDGAKLSKRHGALGVEAYQEMGFLPEALCNYLLRLGWSHGDDELINREEATRWFNLESIGRSPSRFDMEKLKHVNAHYMRLRPHDELVDLLMPFLAEKGHMTLSQPQKDRLLRGMSGIKDRAKDLRELAENALIYVQELPYPIESKAAQVLTPANLPILKKLQDFLPTLSAWDEAALEASLRQFATDNGWGFGQVAQPIRSALTGRTVSPSIFEMMHVLGLEICKERLSFVIHQIETQP